VSDAERAAILDLFKDGPGTIPAPGADMSEAGRLDWFMLKALIRFKNGIGCPPNGLTVDLCEFQATALAYLGWGPMDFAVGMAVLFALVANRKAVGEPMVCAADPRKGLWPSRNWAQHIELVASAIARHSA
jgi:hypothetical protein